MARKASDAPPKPRAPRRGLTAADKAWIQEQLAAVCEAVLALVQQQTGDAGAGGVEVIPGGSPIHVPDEYEDADGARRNGRRIGFTR